MLAGTASKTALGAARRRAAHQIFEGGSVFSDPFAFVLPGLDRDEIAAESPEEGRGLRFFLAARSAFAEKRLAEARSGRGVGQYVILGAGLDSFAWRRSDGEPLRIFEVDHPATQAWKRERAAAAGMDAARAPTFVAVDFERDDLVERLVACGYDPEARGFFTWLGVVPYLTPADVAATLKAVGRLAGGAEIVFDYTRPTDSLDPAQRALRLELEKRVSAAGEPLRSAFTEEAMATMLGEAGFASFEDLGPRALFDLLVPGAGGANAPTSGAQIVHART